VSRYGMIAFASSLDQAGVLARSAEDAAVVLAAMARLRSDGLDQRRPAVPDYAKRARQANQGPAHRPAEGIFRRRPRAGARACVETAIKRLRELGAVTQEISLPNSPLSVPTYYVVAPAEASSNLARYDGVRYGHRAAGAKTLEEL